MMPSDGHHCLHLDDWMIKGMGGWERPGCLVNVMNGGDSGGKVEDPPNLDVQRFLEIARMAEDLWGFRRSHGNNRLSFNMF